MRRQIWKLQITWKDVESEISPNECYIIPIFDDLLMALSGDVTDMWL